MAKIGEFLWRIVVFIFEIILSPLPFFKKFFWKRWYNWLSRDKTIEVDFLFMNYGHHEVSENKEKLRNGEYLKKERSFYSPDNETMARLYFYLCESFSGNFRGKSLIEVGSGRGGGARFISQNYPISSFIGIDLSTKNIDFSKDLHKNIPQLSFMEGDAEKLPLAEGSVDIVFNVESSHCYPRFETFISEVSRVLKTGGHFIFCDFRPKEEREGLLKVFKKNGLEVLSEVDITPNILAALDFDSEKRIALIKRLTPKFMYPIMKIFSGVKGTLVYENFKKGKLDYFHFVLAKKSKEEPTRPIEEKR
ncbi:methyltransferase domain-containing protein [Bacteriovoracales bacterium]|nr:methyltransferase domain-containing protein [Bacteriovoracales bacterium]